MKKTTRRISLLMAMFMVLTMCFSPTVFAAETDIQVGEVEYVLQPGESLMISAFGSGSVGAAPSSGTTYAGPNFTADGTYISYNTRATDAVGNSVSVYYNVSLIRNLTGGSISSITGLANGATYYSGTSVTNGQIYHFNLSNNSSYVLYIKVSYTIS